MSRASSPQAARRVLAAGSFLPLLLAGCGNQYRPVVSAVNPVGPAGQPTKYAVVLSNPGPGMLTFVDFSGDTTISTPSVQTCPNYLAVNTSGSEGYTVNGLGTLDNFGVSNPSALRTVDVAQATLPSGANPNTCTASLNISPISLSGSSGAGLFIPETTKNSVAALTASGQLVQEVTVPAVPQYVVGADNTPRVYSLNSNGTASSIENSTGSGLIVSTNLTVGANPVYGLMDASARRAYVLNGGSQSVSVINVVNNTLDAGVPGGTISLPNVTDGNGNLTASAANPVWADFNPATNLLAVLSTGDGAHPGVLTLINIPLCNASTLPTNPNCNATNPVDATGYGTILKSVPVGVNAKQVSVLQDASTPRAYVANAGNGTTPGSVSVVDLTSGVVTTTLSVQSDASNLALPTVFGLTPTTIAATTGNPTGKVYVTSPDSKYVTVIRTQTDTVLTHIPLLGPGIRVVVNER